MSNPLQTRHYVEQIISAVMTAHQNNEITLTGVQKSPSGYPLWLKRRLRRIVLRVAREHLKHERSLKPHDLDALLEEIMDLKMWIQHIPLPTLALPNPLFPLPSPTFEASKGDPQP